LAIALNLPGSGQIEYSPAALAESEADRAFFRAELDALSDLRITVS
jgi:hypothetical protein